jgi:radical SAM superfamily enzyme YgiQ (UPF0313 family)
MTDRDMWIAKNILPKNTGVSERKPRKNLTAVDISYATRNTKLTLCVFPSWAVFMPPYNMARLCGLTREAGYLTKVYDFNVDAYHELVEQNEDLLNAWDSGNWYFWRSPEYFKIIHPTLEPIMHRYIDTLINDNPDIIGFSLYWSNLEATQWVFKEIKRRRPDITIVIGGPLCAEQPFTPPENVDYYFIGESEHNLLEFLNNWEQGIKPEKPGIGSLYSDVRIDLDSLPYPDYNDFDLDKYWAQNSVCSELSRGCVAQCSYCTEVWFWKFRDRGSKSILDELEFQVKTYGIVFVQFVDSLVNGNLKEYRAFCQGLVERNLGIGWWAYARCDGRVDLEFYKLIKAAGAVGFSYGIETGSDKVLLAINKKNTVAEINQNLIDAHSVGLKSNCCLVIGAPGEDIEALTHTFNLLWNHRERISAVSPGTGLGDSRGSLYDDRDRYGINERGREWLSGWYSLDFTNTKVHRYVRIKLVHMWIHMCVECGGTLENIHKTGDEDITKHYTSKINSEMINSQIEYENFDYNIINSNYGNFANSLMNEVFGFLRMLWRTRGGYEITINFDPTQDRNDFLPVMTLDNQFEYSATVYFKIDDDGNYTADMKFKFVNLDKPWWLKEPLDFEHHYQADGKWEESVKIKPKKVFFAKVETFQPPVESVFSQISAKAQTYLYQLLKTIPSNSHVVDVKASLGGLSAILASVNSTIQVHAIEEFQEGWVKHCYENIQGYLERVLMETMFDKFRDKKRAKRIMNLIDSDFLEDPTGKLVFKRNTKNFDNITLHETLADVSDPIHLCITGDYENPSFAHTIDSVEKHIVPGGYLIATLYHSDKHPDIVFEIDKLISSGWTSVFQEEAFIVIQKP